MQSPQSDLTPWTLTIDRIENRSKSKTAEIETAEIKECLYNQIWYIPIEHEAACPLFERS